MGEALAVRHLTLSESNDILEVSRMLYQAERLGAPEDEPEGARYIQISDTLARKIAKNLQAIALP